MGYGYQKKSEMLIRNVKKIPLKTWHTIDANTRMMILPDSTWPLLDTALLVEYKGHRILNIVDCCNPNGGSLPSGIDVLLTSRLRVRTSWEQPPKSGRRGTPDAGRPQDHPVGGRSSSLEGSSLATEIDALWSTRNWELHKKGDL